MHHFITFAFDDRHRLEIPIFLHLPSEQETLAAVEVFYHKVGLIQTSAFHNPIVLGFTWRYSHVYDQGVQSTREHVKYRRNFSLIQLSTL